MFLDCAACPSERVRREIAFVAVMPLARQLQITLRSRPRRTIDSVFTVRNRRKH